MDRLVFAYSGDLETTVAIPWLRDVHHADVIAVIVDLGQDRDLEGLRSRALAAGAVRAHVLDAREEFASSYVLRALRADASGDQPAGLAASFGPLGRALIVSKLVEVAAVEQAHTIAHGSGDEGRASFEAIARALDPSITIFALVPEWAHCGMATRAEQVEYARVRGILVPGPFETTLRADSSLWGLPVAGPGADEDAFTLTQPPDRCPDDAASVEIAFERGVPTAINGVEMPLLDLIASLTVIAGANGVGRIHVPENRDTASGPVIPMMIYEAPAAVAMHQAHAELQRIVSASEADRFSRIAGRQYRDVLRDGQWFTPLREALDAYVDKVQERVTGTIRLRLCKGDSSIVRSVGDAIAKTAPAGLVHPSVVTQ